MLDGRRLDESTGAIAEEAEAQRRKKERAKGKLFTARRWPRWRYSVPLENEAE
jgi:hypothetical protein